MNSYLLGKVIKSNTENGNVLLLILIAVVLFAALSYAVTKSSNTSGNDISREQEQLTQTVTDNCEISINTAVLRLKSTGGCAPDQISYELPDGRNENVDNPDDTNCFIFHQDGAGGIPCGAYADPSVETGQITSVGDTTTIALTAAGIYFQCLSWSASDCVPQFSDNGTDFVNNNQVCILKGDGSDAGRGIGASSFVPSFGSALCQGACGGNSSGTYRQPPGGTQFYIEDDYSMTAYTGVCDRTLRDFECICW